MTVVAIIGGGLSGAALAMHLRETGDTGDSVIVIEPRNEVGLGQAFSTRESVHLLNVLPGRMSPFPARPGDFTDFAAARGRGGEDYLPRAFYADYLRDRFSSLRHDGRQPGGPALSVLRGKAVGIEKSTEDYQIALADGRTCRADKIVLALGNLAPRPPLADAPGLYGTDRYVEDPWKPGFIETFATDERVLIIGTGLSMVDVLLSLEARRHRGPIIALSRHGLVPRPQAASACWPLPLPPGTASSVSALFHLLRRQAGLAESTGVPWQAVVDALRQQIPSVWRHLSAEQQRRFLRHVRPWWDAHRHRIPASAARSLASLRESGQLRVVAGRLRACRADAGEVQMEVAPRGGGDHLTFAIDRVINCTGPNYDIVNADQPLIKTLADAGVLTLDRNRLGVAVSDDYALIDRGGQASRHLYAMGPMLRGQFWEINAAAEIGEQAASLAHRLLAPARRSPVPSTRGPSHSLRETAVPTPSTFP